MAKFWGNNFCDGTHIKRWVLHKIKKCILCKLLINIITNLEVPVKHIRPNKYLFFSTRDNFLLG